MISMLHIHRNISQISNEILQWYCGNNFSYVKDSKGLAESLKEQKVVTDETVVSFNCNGLFTSIPVTVALKVINRKFTECIDQRVTDYFLEGKYLLHAQSYLALEMVLNNCVFSFQEILYHQDQVSAMGCSVSQVIANIYMEYFGKVSKTLNTPYLPLGRKDMWMILLAEVKKEQVDILFNHLIQ